MLSLLKRQKSDEILFHHRYPTSTDNVRNACHPFSTKDYFENNYITVHNGVLHNEYDLEDAHKLMGVKYVSEQPNGQFNDSEALAYDIAMYLEGWQDKIKAEGSIAFITIKRDKTGKATKLFFGRNTGNPLVMKKTKNSITLSSEGKGEMIEPNQLYCMDYDTLEITKRPLTIPTGYTYRSSYYNNYTDYRYDSQYNDKDWEDYGYDSLNRIISKEHDIIKNYYDTDKSLEAIAIAEDIKEECDGLLFMSLSKAKKRLDAILTRMDELDEAVMVFKSDADVANTVAEYNKLDEERATMEEVVQLLEEDTDTMYDTKSLRLEA